MLPNLKLTLDERYKRIVVLSLVIQFCLVTLHTVFLKCLITPTLALSTFTSTHFFISQLILGFVLLALIYLHLKATSVQPLMLLSYIKAIKYWVSLKQLSQVISFCGSGVIYAACLNGIVPLNCLRNKDLFCLFSGAAIGFKFYIVYVTSHLYCVKFEPIQQLKVPLLKSKIRPILGSSLKYAAKHLLQFLSVFVIIGGVVYWLIPIEHLLCQQGLSAFAVINELLGWNLVENLAISFTFITSLSAMLIISQTMLTEEYRFPLSALGQAMANPSDPLIGYLAHKDFRQLALTSERRRSELFSISAPGGHPHIWNSVSAAAMDTIRHFINELNPKQDNITTKPKASSPEKPLNLNQNMNMRSLSSPVNYNNNGIAMQTQTTVAAPSVKKLDLLLSLLIPTSFTQYLKNEASDLKLEEIYSKSQSVVWALDGLSAALVASYREDLHGVAQWSLVKGVSLMLDLYIALERLNNRKGRNGAQPNEQGLKATTSTAIYRIVTKFYHHLNASDFSEEHWLRVCRFKDYSE